MRRIVMLDDGRAATIVTKWTEPSRWNGRNDVGAFTNDQYRRCDLGRTETGAWIMLPSSSWQGEHPLAYEVGPERAAGWFAACGIALPAELEGAAV
jgi:hypothetical protein